MWFLIENRIVLKFVDFNRTNFLRKEHASYCSYADRFDGFNFASLRKGDKGGP